VALRSGQEIATDVLVVGKGWFPGWNWPGKPDWPWRPVSWSMIFGNLGFRYLCRRRLLPGPGRHARAKLDQPPSGPWPWSRATMRAEHGRQPAAYPGSLGLNSLKTPRFHLINAGLLKSGRGVTFLREGISRPQPVPHAGRAGKISPWG